MHAIRIHETGGVETMRVDEIAVPAPGAGEVRLRVEAAGVNFIDTYQRSGLYVVPLPHTLGMEAAGEPLPLAKLLHHQADKWYFPLFYFEFPIINQHQLKCHVHL